MHIMNINALAGKAVVALTAFAVALLGTAHAQTISINFQNPGGAITGTTGFVPTANWNNASGSFTPDPSLYGSLTNLVDSNGIATGVDLSYVGAGYQNAAISGGSSDDRALLNSFSYGSASYPLSVTLSSLDSVYSGGYDVYVYFTNANSFHVIGYTLGSTTVYSRTMGNYDFGSLGWVNGQTETLPTPVDGNDYLDIPQGNYVKFSAVSGASFTLNVSNPSVNGSGFNYAAISGLQIVAAGAPVPEPATVALWLGGVMLSVAVWRRRCAR